MNFSEYQDNIRPYIDYPLELGPFQIILDLTNNVGILSNKLYNVLNNGENGVFSDEEKAKVAISLGDILNNITNMASDLNISLDEIIALNLKKIELQNKRKNLNT